MRSNKRITIFWLVLLACLFSLSGGCTRETRIEILRYERQVEEQRLAKDKYFREPANSPLLPEQIGPFKGLKYFPIDHKYKVMARLLRQVDATPFMIQESNGSARTYTRQGKLEFELAGKTYTLMAYRESGQPRKAGEAEVLFIPFTDLTTGQESYGAGRYLEPEVQSGEVVLLDFNLAYNPYCAYNSKWSCPIPPPENKLGLEIRAGEKSFH